jgi:hypothetical protein
MLRGEVELYVPWMVWLAEISPRIVLKDVETTPLGSALFRIRAVVENEGYLPTNITQRALDAEVAVPVRAFVELTDAELVSGPLRTDIGHLLGTRDAQRQAGTAAMRRTIEYVVRVTGDHPRVSITARSEKGGTVRAELALGGG